ncbi:hypothetical protein FRB97_002858 [Tulasnella sp. 331]|nr:hypothetical protein FRB97_002858 [Tulasnella sp. 331]
MAPSSSSAAPSSSGRKNAKRSRDEEPSSAGERLSKISKTDATPAPKPSHPVSNSGTSSASATNPGGALQWLPTIGKACHHGIHLTPKSSTKVASFDLDGTLIRTASGAPFYKDYTDWKWWGENDVVIKKLKALLDEGYAIVIISNQAVPGNIKDAKKRQAYQDKFLMKIPFIAAQIPDIPFRLLAATEKDQYRKPMVNTWYELERIFKEDGVEIDRQSSFYVGDAAGRSGDHNISDRLFAMNLELPFHTPEEFFLNKPPKPFKMKGFNPSSMAIDPATPLFTPATTPLIPLEPAHAEIVVFVGYPGVGKSTFYKKHFAPAGYTHVNQDTLKTKPKCVKAVKDSLAAGKSCVVEDNTNRDINVRQDYIDIAKELKVSIRAFHFDMPLELAWHINLYRAFCLSDAVKEDEAVRELVPKIAYSGFNNAFQKPTTGEGFTEVKTINWIFDGSDEDRKRFNMYLDIF